MVEVEVRVEDSSSASGLHRLREFWFWWDGQRWRSTKELTRIAERVSPEFSRGFALRCVLDVPENTILKRVYILDKTINPRREFSYYIVRQDGLAELSFREFKDYSDGKIYVEFPELNLTIPAK